MAASKIQPNMGIWHLIAGIVIAVLGVYVWFNPAATLLGLALYLGIIFIVVGAGYFMLSFSNRSGWYLTVGILDMLVGAYFFMYGVIEIGEYVSNRRLMPAEADI